MHSARVSEVDPKYIEAIFDNDHIVTAGASGAPVLNAAGEVIGVYSGHFNADGHVGINMISAARVIADIKAAPAQ
jgi:V8-like Glu-specific endopeptidase